MENEKIEQSDEEISLIDLLAILLRYRKLILIGTLATIVVGLFCIFVPPQIQKSKQAKIAAQEALAAQEEPVEEEDVQKVTIVYTITCHQYKPNIYENFGLVLSNSFKSLPTIAAEYNAHPFLGKEYKDEREFNNFINSFVKSNFFALDVSNDRNQSIFQLSATMEEDNIAEFKKFLALHMKNLSKTLSDSKSITPTFEYFTLSGEPFVYDASSSSSSSSSSYTKKIIILVFASLLVFILIAFIINAIKNVKQDSKASSTIRDAWDSGKKTAKKPDVKLSSGDSRLSSDSDSSSKAE